MNPTRRPVWYLLTLHWLSLTGVALVATALISWLFVLPLSIRGHTANPYLGIVSFLILPVIFFLGLALIPIGIYLARRQLRKGVAEAEFDRKKIFRRVGWFFTVTTLLNIVIGTQVTYRAVKHMETEQFCGATCHVMKPEFSAYRNVPHSPQFNALQPFGSLQYNYCQLLASLAVDVAHNVTAKAGWNYYQYGEDSFVGPTAPRYFHANNTTLAVRWAF